VGILPTDEVKLYLREKVQEGKGISPSLGKGAWCTEPYSLTQA